MGYRRMNGGRWRIRMIGLLGLLMTIGPASGQEASKGARPVPWPGTSRVGTWSPMPSSTAWMLIGRPGRRPRPIAC